MHPGPKCKLWGARARTADGRWTRWLAAHRAMEIAQLHGEGSTLIVALCCVSVCKMTVGSRWSRHLDGPALRLRAAAAAAAPWMPWMGGRWRVHVNSGSDDKIACARQQHTSYLQHCPPRSSVQNNPAAQVQILLSAVQKSRASALARGCALAVRVHSHTEREAGNQE